MKKFYFFILTTAGILIFISLNQNIKAAIPQTVTKESVINEDVTIIGASTDKIQLTGNTDHIYHITGNLTINGNIPGSKTGVIFVDKNLTFGPTSGGLGPVTFTQLTYGDANSGLVFVVKGDIRIHPSFTRIDAVLISEGNIYTAVNPTDPSCSTSSVTVPTPLTINGSLISIKQPDPSQANSAAIMFCRKLADNSQAAETVNYQPKYLVILRDLLSDTLQRWSEIDANTPTASSTTTTSTPVTCNNGAQTFSVNSNIVTCKPSSGGVSLSQAATLCPTNWHVCKGSELPDQSVDNSVLYACTSSCIVAPSISSAAINCGGGALSNTWVPGTGGTLLLQTGNPLQAYSDSGSCSPSPVSGSFTNFGSAAQGISALCCKN